MEVVAAHAEDAAIFWNRESLCGSLRARPAQQRGERSEQRRSASATATTCRRTAFAVVAWSLHFAIDVSRRASMLYYALVFLIVALIAGVLGFTGLAGVAANIVFFVRGRGTSI
jgi:uncharacterized membrane protein